MICINLLIGELDVEESVGPLLMYPEFDFIRLAKKHGYSGYQNGLYDLFIFDYNDVDQIDAAEDT